MLGAHELEKHCWYAFLQALRIEQEQQAAHELLINVFPSEIAERLKRSSGRLAESHDNVSVIFADLVGFTPLSERLQPGELVELLDTIFSAFDTLCERRGIDNIKTLGDAYRAAGGLLQVSSTHLEDIALLGLDMLEVIEHWREKSGYPLALRVGIHAGPVVAGVIGQRRFIYDLWGDTVNTASRMESHGEAGRVLVSGTVAEALAGTLSFEPRGPTPIKGKGTMETHWLIPPARSDG
jgi:class 3 adenylate cyclase